LACGGGVGLGAGVEAQAADDGHAQGAVGGAVAAAVEATALGASAEAGSGATPQSTAKLASLVRRSGLLPAVTGSWPAISVPMPMASMSWGASSATSGPMSCVEVVDLIAEFEDAAGQAAQRDAGGDRRVADLARSGREAARCGWAACA
jgi:hypothetical protein